MVWMFLLACAADPKVLGDLDADPIGLALCNALEESAVDLMSLPAGSNGPEAYAPDVHQAIALHPQGEGLFTGSVSYTVPESGLYRLAFSSPVDALFRPVDRDPFVGEELASPCTAIGQLLEVELRVESVTLQIGDAEADVVSFVGSDLVPTQ